MGFGTRKDVCYSCKIRLLTYQTTLASYERRRSFLHIISVTKDCTFWYVVFHGRYWCQNCSFYKCHEYVPLLADSCEILNFRTVQNFCLSKAYYNHSSMRVDGILGARTARAATDLTWSRAIHPVLNGLFVSVAVAACRTIALRG